MEKLPNPAYYYETSKTGSTLKVHYLKHDVNPYTLYIADQTKAANYVETEFIEFEIVPNKNVWHWQPVNPITIEPVVIGPYRKQN